VGALFVALVLADLVAAGAVDKLLFALAAGVPVVLLHAAFRVRDDLEPAPDGGDDDKDKDKEDGVVVEKKEDGDVETGPMRRSMATATTKS
jgi:hypothetical protein